MEERVLSGHESGVVSVEVTPNGMGCIRAAEEWYLQNEPIVPVLILHENASGSVTSTPDGKRIVISVFTPLHSIVKVLGYFKEIIIQKESGAEGGSGQSIFPSQGDVRSAVQGKPWL